MPLPKALSTTKGQIQLIRILSDFKNYMKENTKKWVYNIIDSTFSALVNAMTPCLVALYTGAYGIGYIPEGRY